MSFANNNKSYSTLFVEIGVGSLFAFLLLTILTNKREYMNYNIIKYNWLIPGYFIFAALDMVIGFLGYTNIQKFSLLYLIICTFFVFAKKDKYYDSIDVLIILLTIFIIVGALLSTVSPTIIWAGIRYQLFLMIFFFVGKYYLDNDRFMDIGKYVIMGNAILGLFLFITEPAWYVSWKMNKVSFDATQGNLYYEMARLSSLSSYPYWVSYSSFILYVYCLVNFLFYTRKIKDYIVLGFLFVIMLLCQQRTPIMFAILSTVFLIYKVRTEKYNKENIGCIPMLTALFVIGLLVFYMFSNLESGQHDFIIDKLNSMISGNDLIEERTSIFKKKVEVSLFGVGIGRYSHNAMAMNKDYIPDQQYLRILYETGITGTFFYGLIFIKIVLRGIRYIKECTFDLLVVLFYLFSMIGANSLSMEGYHTAVFWFCSGRLFNKSYIQYKQNL